jgi:gliding motility-associated-like protein
MIRFPLFLCLCIIASLAFADGDKLEIFNSPENPPEIPYCKGEVPVAGSIAITGRDLNQPNDGIKVSVANFRRGEDTLIFRGSTSLRITWDNNKGEIIITGNGKASEYQDAIRQVFYANLADSPTRGNRNLVVTLSDADYLPYTGHFYRYIPATGIYWTHARDSAASMTYNGWQGYLATITSAIENDFIWEKTKGVGWIGASDAESEGRWEWVTGPEAGEQFWQGNQTGRPVNGMYNNWNTGEPNNVRNAAGEGENYAHINMNPSTRPASWNDLPNQSGAPGSYYHSQGFLVEFGGMPDDPPLRLSASQVIRIDKVAFSGKREFDICQGEKIRINPAGSSVYQYSWSPAEYISSATEPNPQVSPVATTVYRGTGSFGSVCTDTASYRVNVRNLPVSSLTDEYVLCEGRSVVLDPGVHSSYFWSDGSTGQTSEVFQPGTWTVTLKNDHCSLTAKTSVRQSGKPVLLVDASDTLVCGIFSKRLPIAISEGASLLSAITPGLEVNRAGTSEPELSVSGWGTYRSILQMTNLDGCVFDTTLSISFRHQPTAGFNIDSVLCYGYNLQVEYRGTRTADALFGWYSADTLFSQGINLERDTIPLGRGDDVKRSVYLIVNEQGCIAESPKISVKIKPELSFDVVTTEGCSPMAAIFTSVANPSITGWKWDFGDGGTGNTREAVHTYQNMTGEVQSYKVGLAITDSKGCVNEDFINDAVTVYPKSTAQFSYSPKYALITNPEFTFTNGSLNATDFQWDFGDGSGISDLFGPVHRYSGLGSYRIMLFASNQWGCIDSVSARVAVTFDRLFPPTAFSPNSSLETDREFRIYSDGVMEEGYHLKIFNRWGELIFESRSPDHGWDGKMKNGQNAPGGTYTWVLQFFDLRDEKHHQQGAVTLLY